MPYLRAISQLTVHVLGPRVYRVPRKGAVVQSAADQRKTVVLNAITQETALPIVIPRCALDVLERFRPNIVPARDADFDASRDWTDSSADVPGVILDHSSPPFDAKLDAGPTLRSDH